MENRIFESLVVSLQKLGITSIHKVNGKFGYSEYTMSFTPTLPFVYGGFNRYSKLTIEYDEANGKLTIKGTLAGHNVKNARTGMDAAFRNYLTLFNALKECVSSTRTIESVGASINKKLNGKCGTVLYNAKANKLKWSDGLGNEFFIANSFGLRICGFDSTCSDFCTVKNIDRMLTTLTEYKDAVLNILACINQ